MKIIIIVAMDKNGLIGKDNNLPWNFSEDLCFFKKTTMGKSVIMGQKTYESIGAPLKNREVIVLSCNMSFNPKGVKVARSIDEALSFAKEEVYIAGGASVYQQFLSLADEMIITFIDDEFQGNIYFPDFDWSNWQLIEEHKGYNKLLTFKKYKKI